ncbi:hypothetical protein AWC38_SpisGene11875 [Stylophora pistillata]|uniref:Uncharacterized protein n=1 Tax=Stylophora pistillata TaxID=50429 RepID=A0A2B4S548_STYPI|nr:hypothetical protein AWC38_SpisGene11875 [Stylophora pistillata]
MDSKACYMRHLEHNASMYSGKPANQRRALVVFSRTQRKFNMVEEAQMAEGNCSDSDKGDKVTVVTIEDEGSDFTPRDCIETDLPLEQEEGGSGS